MLGNKLDESLKAVCKAIGDTQAASNCGIAGGVRLYVFAHPIQYQSADFCQADAEGSVGERSRVIS
jgi:hypothetical protein